MDSHPVFSPVAQVSAPLKPPSKLVKAIVLAAFLGLLALLLWLTFLHFQPFLSPFGLQILHRLREVSIFLVITTAIALGIFHSPRETVDKKKLATVQSLDQYHLASIFGEMGDSDLDYYTSDATARASANANATVVDDIAEKDGWSNAARSKTSVRLDACSFPTVQAKRVAGTGESMPTHRRNLSASRNEGRLPVYGDPQLSGGAVAQRKLHRKSSSLDDSVDYEPEPQADDAVERQQSAEWRSRSSISDDTSAKMSVSVAHSNSNGAARAVGTPKKVRFSVDDGGDGSGGYSRTSPSSIAGSSPIDLPSANVNNDESTTGRRQAQSPSPNELNRQADAFIAKFKEQIRLQKLESFQRYRRKFS